MTVARRKGDPAKADRLFSLIVRSRGGCERCGDSYGPFDTAHIVRRTYSATRCKEDNAWCLCKPCHKRVDTWAEDFLDLVTRTIGQERYVQLRMTAQTGLSVSSRLFWQGEAARMVERCNELGIDTRKRVA